MGECEHVHMCVMQKLSRGICVNISGHIRTRRERLGVGAKNVVNFTDNRKVRMTRKVTPFRLSRYVFGKVQF